MALKKQKKQFLIIAALILLFATRWMYWVLEMHGQSASSTGLFIAESLFFTAIYMLAVFRAGKMLMLCCAAAGCILLGVWYRLIGAGIDFLLPLSALPAFLFLINQLPDKNGKETVAKISAVLLWVSAAAMAVLFLVSVITHAWQISTKTMYYPIIGFLIAVVYWVLSQIHQSKPGRKATKKANKSLNSFGILSLPSALAILMSGLYLCNEAQILLLQSVLMLWLVNLLVLYDCGHEQLCYAVRRIGKAFPAA